MCVYRRVLAEEMEMKHMRDQSSSVQKDSMPTSRRRGERSLVQLRDEATSSARLVRYVSSENEEERSRKFLCDQTGITWLLLVEMVL